MSKIKPRVKVPKEVSIDEIVEIKTLIRHPMHSGRMKDAEGQTIPRQIINSFSAKFNGKEVFQMDLELKIHLKNLFSIKFSTKRINYLSWYCLTFSIFHSTTMHGVSN